MTDFNIGLEYIDFCLLVYFILGILKDGLRLGKCGGVNVNADIRIYWP